jgi:hypothetical protein
MKAEDVAGNGRTEKRLSSSTTSSTTTKDLDKDRGSEERKSNSTNNNNGDKGKIDEGERTEVYRKVLEAGVRKLLAQVEPHGSEVAGWKVIKDENNILVSKKDVPYSSFYMGRVEGRVKAPAAAIADIVVTLKHEPLMEALDVVQEFDEGEINISHLRCRSSTPLVSARDFCLLRTTYCEEQTGRWICMATSVVSKNVPERAGYVRAQISNSGWVIDPWGEDESFCTYVLSLDPKGWIPSFVVNMFRTQDMFETFRRLKVMAEHKPVVREDTYD